MSADELPRGEHQGQCPECDGPAKVYPTEDGRGHVYCLADDCGWIHRDLPAVDRYVVTEEEQ